MVGRLLEFLVCGCGDVFIVCFFLFWGWGWGVEFYDVLGLLVCLGVIMWELDGIVWWFW